MNRVVTLTIDELEKKMAGYHGLLHFRYVNLCVKSDPASLLPVTVNTVPEESNIEDVADVCLSDEYHITIIPKSHEYERLIVGAIFEAHPEFKPEYKQADKNDEDSRYIIYEMPEVNEDRRVFLLKAVGTLYDECKLRLEAIAAECKLTVLKVIGDAPQQVDEANQKIDELQEQYVENIRKSKHDKEEEIEEGYQRYLKKVQERKQNEPDYDVTSGFRMYEE